MPQMQNFPLNGNVNTTLQDTGVVNNFPGNMFRGTEAGATYFEDREVSGVMWRATNATFNKFSGQWLLANGGAPAFAFTEDAAGNTKFYGAPAGIQPISWSLLWTIAANGTSTINTSSTIPGTVDLSAIGIYNALHYGLSTTDAVGTTNTTSLQAAINACSAAGGGVVLIPNGTYQFNGGLTIPLTGNVNLTGETIGSTVLVQNANADFFTVANGSIASGNNFNMLHLEYASTSLTGNAFTLINVDTQTFTEVRVTHATHGWYMFDAGNITLTDCATQMSTNGVSSMYLDGGNPAHNHQSAILIKVTGCTFVGTQGSNIILGNADTISFSDCHFYGCDNEVDIGNQLVTTNLLRGNTGHPGIPSSFSGGTPFETSLLDFINCEFDQGTTQSCFYIHPPTYFTYPWNVLNVRFTESRWGGMRGVYMTNDTTATYPGAPSSSYGLTAGVFIGNCVATFNNAYGIHIQAGSNINISGGFYASNAIAGLFIDDTLGGGGNVFNVSVSGAQFTGMVGNGGSQNTGITIAGNPQNTLIAACDLSHHNPASGAGYSIQLTGSPNNTTIVACNLAFNKTAGILFSGTPQGVLVSSCILQGASSGIPPVDSSGFTVSNCVISDCIGYNDQHTVLLNATGSATPVSSNDFTFSGTPYMGPMVAYIATGGNVALIGGGLSPAGGMTSGTFYLSSGEVIQQASPGTWTLIGQ